MVLVCATSVEVAAAAEVVEDATADEAAAEEAAADEAATEEATEEEAAAEEAVAEDATAEDAAAEEAAADDTETTDEAAATVTVLLVEVDVDVDDVVVGLRPLCGGLHLVGKLDFLLPVLEHTLRLKREKRLLHLTVSPPSQYGYTSTLLPCASTQHWDSDLRDSATACCCWACCFRRRNRGSR